MSDPRNLLTRIEYPNSPTASQRPGNFEALRDSVREHLQLMLNTRHGSSITVPDYGTRDFADVGTGKDAFAELRQDVLQSIIQYEPRLTDVEVQFHPVENDPFNLHFDIVAKLVSEDGSCSAVFHSRVAATGEVRIEAEI